VVHAIDGNQTGMEFWIPQVWGAVSTKSCKGELESISAVNVFCPKGNMGIRMTSDDGYSATYTSNGIDQCVSFRQMTLPLESCASDGKRNFRIEVLPAGVQGNVTTVYAMSLLTQK